MRNKILFCAALLFVCTFSMQVNAQLQVDATGNVAIGISELEEPQSQLSVGCVGNANTELSVYKSGTYSGSQYGIVSHLNLNPHSGKIASIKGKCTGGASNMIGVHGESLADDYLIALPNGAMIWPIVTGVYGIAGGAIRENYGVYGTLNDNATVGAGVFGTISGGEGLLNERYAGYFKGKTKVNGDFYAQSLNTYTPFPSHVRGNLDIESETIEYLLSLQPLQYPLYDSIHNKTLMHYGVEPQTMQKFFPDLVQVELEGYSINYVELIPLLLMKVQELSKEVESLKQIQRE